MLSKNNILLSKLFYALVYFFIRFLSQRKIWLAVCLLHHWVLSFIMDSGFEVSWINQRSITISLKYSPFYLDTSFTHTILFVFRYYAIETARQRKNVIAVSSGAPLLVGNATNLMTAQNGGCKMPWLTYLRSPALW